MEHDDRICQKCKVKLKERVSVNNLHPSCEDQLTFPLMKIGDSMKFECYIETIYQDIFEKEKKIDRKLIVIN